jgi:sucrose-6-phosphate hydrolase SacC (GH32 family)
MGAMVAVAAAVVATAQDGWQVDSRSPVLTAGGSPWDAAALGQPCVRLEEGTFRMWYAGAAADLRGRILLAESPDGVQWTRTGGPALDVAAAGAWDGWTLDTPEVVRAGDTWYLYYFGQREEAVPEGSSIGLATSSDGVTFTRHQGNPVLGPGPPGSWEERWVESPAVLRDETTGRWIMLYTGLDAAWRASVGLATSADGIHWQKSPDNPVLTPSPSPAFDDYWAGVPTLLRWRSVLWMFYAGVSEADLGDGSADSPAVGLAWSLDGRRWQRGPANPVFDDDAPWAPGIVLDEARHRLLMWFESPTGINLAVAPEPPSVRTPPGARIRP